MGNKPVGDNTFYSQSIIYWESKPTLSSKKWLPSQTYFISQKTTWLWIYPKVLVLYKPKPKKQHQYVCNKNFSAVIFTISFNSSFIMLTEIQKSNRCDCVPFICSIAVQKQDILTSNLMAYNVFPSLSCKTHSEHVFLDLISTSLPSLKVGIRLNYSFNSIWEEQLCMLLWLVYSSHAHRGPLLWQPQYIQSIHISTVGLSGPTEEDKSSSRDLPQ